MAQPLRKKSVTAPFREWLIGYLNGDDGAGLEAMLGSEPVKFKCYDHPDVSGGEFYCVLDDFQAQDTSTFSERLTRLEFDITCLVHQQYGKGKHQIQGGWFTQRMFDVVADRLHDKSFNLPNGLRIIKIVSDFGIEETASQKGDSGSWAYSAVATFTAQIESV